MNARLPSTPWRTLALQASFNPRGMQRIGWWFALAPWVRRLDPPERGAWLRQTGAVFNTNPYLAPVLLGARCRIEEEQGAELAARVETTLQRTLGSVGDALIWRAARPVWFLGTAIAGFALGPGAVLAMWLLFAVGVLVVHRRGLAWGYRWGLEVVERLPSGRLHLAARTGRRVAAVLAGAIGVGILTLTLVAGGGGIAVGAAGAAFGTGFVVSRCRRGAEWLLLLVMAGLVLYARWSGSFPEAVITWR